MEKPGTEPITLVRVTEIARFPVTAVPGMRKQVRPSGSSGPQAMPPLVPTKVTTVASQSSGLQATQTLFSHS